MISKICRKCHIEKPLSDFYFRKEIGKYRSECKSCKNACCNIEHKKEYNKQRYYHNKSENQKRIYKNYINIKLNEPWKLVSKNIRGRCRCHTSTCYKYYGGRGIECRITDEEVRKLWIRDKAYEMKKPSIDRIDNDGHYEFSNCRFIELAKNISEMNTRRKRKPILQYGLDGKFIREWKSQSEAKNATGISNINSCVHNKYKHAGGYIWRFKK